MPTFPWRKATAQRKFFLQTVFIRAVPAVVRVDASGGKQVIWRFPRDSYRRFTDRQACPRDDHLMDAGGDRSCDEFIPLTIPQYSANGLRRPATDYQPNLRVSRKQHMQACGELAALRW